MSVTMNPELVIALVGRPNVGKSTLFNVLTKSRDALVADYPGLTRDRQYGRFQFNNAGIIIIDTGGLRRPPTARHLSLDLARDPEPVQRVS